jgi:serine/threonine protein phosphatase 1
MIWAIGDIHGMFDPLQRLLAEIRLCQSDEEPIEKIVFIGDYIDHGPSSKEVIDLIRRLDYETVLLMGNHEDMALRFIKQDLCYLKANGNTWLANGVADTYLSLCSGEKSLEKYRQM